MATLDILTEAHSKYERLSKLRETVAEHKMLKVRQKLLEASKVSPDDAKKWYDSIDKDDKTLQISFNQVPGRKEMLSESLTEVYRLTRGKLGTLKALEIMNPRAFASKARGVINTGYEPTPQVISHEAGHHLEYGKAKYAESSRDFIELRATSHVPTRLSELTGNKGFGDEEIALKDSFIHPYVGKLYGGRGSPTEVISMGLEHFATPSLMYNLYTKDPKHFEYILGVILSE